MFCKFNRDKWELEWSNGLMIKLFNQIIEDVKNPASNNEIHGGETIEFEGDIIRKAGKTFFVYIH